MSRFDSLSLAVSAARVTWSSLSTVIEPLPNPVLITWSSVFNLYPPAMKTFLLVLVL